MSQDRSYSWSPRTVLLVDDEASVRAVAARVLRENGYLVVEAASATEALSMAEQHQGDIDLVVTDLVMRGMGGRELAGKLRETRPGLRILFISGYSLEQLDLDPSAVDADFMEKPFAPADLSERVGGLLNG